MPAPETACPVCSNPELGIIVAQLSYAQWDRDASGEWECTEQSGPQPHFAGKAGCSECEWAAEEADNDPTLRALYHELLAYLRERGVSVDGETLPTKEGQERLAI